MKRTIILGLAISIIIFVVLFIHFNSEKPFDGELEIMGVEIEGNGLNYNHDISVLRTKGETVLKTDSAGIKINNLNREFTSSHEYLENDVVTHFYIYNLPGDGEKTVEIWIGNLYATYDYII